MGEGKVAFSFSNFFYSFFLFFSYYFLSVLRMQILLHLTINALLCHFHFFFFNLWWSHKATFMLCRNCVIFYILFYIQTFWPNSSFGYFPYRQLLSFFLSTVCENIIANIKMRNNFWYLFQYCDSNIGLFFIAPHLIIALPPLRYQILSLLISLLKILYKFCRLVYCFFSVLLPI